MGRNIFQSDSPVSMLQAVRAVVHNNETPKQALELYNTLKNQKPAQKK
jgi:putative autoinducer-2 (AI-2) aldolase